MVNCKCLLCNFMIPMQNESYLWYSNGHSLYRRLVCKTNPPDHTFWFCCHWTNYHLQNYIKFPISEPMTHDSVQQQGTFVKRRHHDSIGTSNPVEEMTPLRRPSDCTAPLKSNNKREHKSRITNDLMWYSRGAAVSPNILWYTWWLCVSDYHGCYCFFQQVTIRNALRPPNPWQCQLRYCGISAKMD